MSNIEKEYVDYSGLQEYDGLIKGVISTDFVGATSSTDGVAGRVPAPDAGDENNYLRGDGTWSPVSVTGAVSGVKGAAESTYRQGNVELTPANLGMVASKSLADAGTYNIIPCLHKSCEKNGITFTNNGDGSYTLDGTATAGYTFDLLSNETTEGGAYSCRWVKNTLMEREWTLSIGSTSIVGLELQVRFTDGDLTHVLTPYVGGTNNPIRTLTPTTERKACPLMNVCLSVASGTVLSNVTVYPSLTPTDIYDFGFTRGSLSNDVLSDIVAMDSLVFTGTTTSWNSLPRMVKSRYKVAILTDV